MIPFLKEAHIAQVLDYEDYGGGRKPVDRMPQRLQDYCG